MFSIIAAIVHQPAPPHNCPAPATGSKFLEQAAVAFYPVVDAAFAERVPHDRLQRGDHGDAEFLFDHLDHVGGGEMGTGC